MTFAVEQLKKKTDYIKRLEATEYPVMPKKYRHYQTCNLDDAYEKGWEDLQILIARIPAANVKEITDEENHWIFGSIMGKAWMKCSKCLKSQNRDGTFLYCPCCGAEMNGEVEHEGD